ncbi:MAG TPA: HNH endonuclease [Ktedonobacteraceae bacterium]
MANKKEPPKKPEGKKWCNGCKQWKPATTDVFFVDNSAGDKLKTPCKQCSQDIYRRKHPLSPQEELPEGHKRCTKCKQVKESTEEFFHLRVGRKAGLTSRCKKCRNEDRKEYEQAHPRPYDKDHEHARYIARRETVLQQRFRYYRTHLVEYAIYYQQYRKTHIEQGRVYGNNRRARERAARGIHTSEQIREQYDRQKGKCYYCHKKVKWGEHVVDHTYPLSRDNGDDPVNDISYLVITCVPCNASKKNKYPWEWPQGGRLL